MVEIMTNPPDLAGMPAEQMPPEMTAPPTGVDAEAADALHVAMEAINQAAGWYTALIDLEAAKPNPNHVRLDEWNRERAEAFHTSGELAGDDPAGVEQARQRYSELAAALEETHARLSAATPQP
jgi:hypothetical protein